MHAFGSIEQLYGFEDGMARDSNTDGTGPGPTPCVPKKNEDRISKALKQVYNEVAEEALPDRLNDLLAKLKSDKGS